MGRFLALQELIILACHWMVSAAFAEKDTDVPHALWESLLGISFN